MKTTTNIEKLKEEGLLYDADFYTNEQVINAAAILAYRNGITDAASLYNTLWDECDMSLAATLNDMDKNELLQYAEVHS
jgi:hypothetical protein